MERQTTQKEPKSPHMCVFDGRRRRMGKGMEDDVSSILISGWKGNSYITCSSEKGV